MDANSYYEYKLKIFQGWEGTMLGMGLSGSRILSKDLFLSKGKLKLMSKQNSQRISSMLLSKLAGTPFLIIWDYIDQSIRDCTAGSRLALAQQRIYSLINACIFFCFQGKRQKHVIRLLCRTVVRNCNCKSPDEACYPFHHLSPIRMPKHMPKCLF